MRSCKKIMFIFAVTFVIAMPMTSIFAAPENVQEVTSEALEANDKTLLYVLTNAADEEAYQRKKMGLQVVGFLLIYAFIMWRVKRKIWEGAHKGKSNSK